MQPPPLPPLDLSALAQAERLLAAALPPHRALADLRKQHPPATSAWAWEMAQVRLHARAKGWTDMLFTREALEQATRHELARHRAQRFAGLGPVIELGAACGADTLHLARVTTGVAVELDPTRALYLATNLKHHQLHHSVLAVTGDAERFPASHFGCGFADPARRQDGKRLLDLNAYSPSLDGLLAHLPGPCAIKLAPAQQAEELFAQPGGNHFSLEWVGWLSELKELVLWRHIPLPGRRVATVFPAGASLAWPDPAPPLWPEQRPLGAFLYDPHPAVTRAGLVGLLASQLQAAPIDSQIAFLTTDHPAPTPFARCLSVLADFPFSLKNARQAIRQHNAGPVEIIKRGSAVDAVELQKELKTNGKNPASLILTRMADKPIGILARAVSPPTI
ncbi:MAG: hypothetical protein LW700_13545 [Gemmataceae bacterium]|nr:hypothetical protein [Gemmataceae bacterium]